ncbi:hypothetical protein [Pseudopontixanthobacter vadosimaris]|uniref:hypothetical protein n=1 Tax=Pseudopontixanthobacter vadosimaris TaxID=2726450 RepID=UPI0014762F5E|nr:hypothetical protein [Pseudopontixanthobacter vadosimaris]
MKKSFAILAATGLALSLAACDVDQTEEGSLPEIEGGNLPEYDVEPADVDVTTGTETIEVPTMDVEINQDDAEGVPVTDPGE